MDTFGLALESVRPEEMMDGLTRRNVTQSIRVAGLGGSLGDRSSSLSALKIALEAARKAGASTTLLDIRLLDLPMFIPDVSEIPQSVLGFVEAIHAADGIILSSPLYHGTISGSFKNALDWFELLADRDPAYLTDKVVGLIAAAGGEHALQAINTMDFAVRALRGWTLPYVVTIPEAWRAFDETGRARDPRLQERLEKLGREVVHGVRRFDWSRRETDKTSLGAP